MRLAAAGILATLVCAPRAGWALRPGLRAEQYTHMEWPSVAHSAEVNGLALDGGGRLWIGTAGGLASFDGQRLVGCDGPDGRAAGTIDAVLVGSDGIVWVGSRDHGLARVRDGRLVPVDSGLPAGRIHALVEDVAGVLWVGSERGPARLPRGAARATLAGEGLPAPDVRALLAAGDGSLWAGLHPGVARWDGRVWHAEMAGLPGDILVDTLWRDGDGGLWLGSRNRGLWRRSRTQGTQGTQGLNDGWQPRGQGLPEAAVRALLRDRQGQLWAATRAGLYWHDQAARVFRAFDLPATVCGTRIAALAEDREGGLWLATDRCGLHRLQDRPFRVYAAADGLPADNILGLAAMPDGTIWAGTRGQGLLRWRDGPGAATPVACPPDLPCSWCWDFSPGPAGAAPSVWMVCSPNTVLGWDGQRIARVPPIPLLPRASFAIGARDGSAWMTVGKKVVRRGSDGVVTSLDAQEVLEGSRVLHQGRDGTVWIIARDGVAAWRHGDVRLVRLPEHERPANPTNVHEDDRGVLWIGTSGEGLRRLQGDRIETVGVLAGLPTGWIVQPLEDDRGRMWMSSGRGIFWVETRQLDEVASGRRATLQANLYDAADGVLMGHDSYGHPAGFQDGAGRLLFATSGGVAVVQPAALGGPGPVATLEDMRLDGKRPSGAARAAASAPADLEVTFGARSFARPETISFRYRLDGRDTDWVEGGAVRVARYAQLPAGDYRLLVEARTREGDWSAAPASVSFSLRPPFHRSPPFVVLCGLAAAMLLVLAHRLRLGRARAAMQATLQERSRLARDLHDTLAQAFVATSVQLDCLDQALRDERGPEARRHLDAARKLVSETLDEARRAVWVLRPQTLDRGLAAALSTLVRRLSGSVTVALDVMGTERTLPPLVASTLLRIAQEAVANAHRHGQAGHIAVQLCYLPDLVTLSVSDDGQGIEGAAPAGDGTGIDGMKQRAAEIGATLHLESAPGKGTTIRLEVRA